ncbi:YciI family protein [Amycolatopsis minnesotensis]|uniref:YciI family protein n=1 Tax=Amycolatopsis minnesotensis TaxID=337894 RepID=A0ABN2QS24_9PSEU
MKYMLLIHVNPAVMATLTDEERASIGDAHGEFIKTIQESGEMIGTQALADPSNTVVVSASGGVPVVTDGPFGEAKEVMGGYYLVDVESKERAIEIAKMIPDLQFDGLTSMEVRPVMFSAGTDM